MGANGQESQPLTTKTIVVGVVTIITGFALCYLGHVQEGIPMVLAGAFIITGRIAYQKQVDAQYKILNELRKGKPDV